MIVLADEVIAHMREKVALPGPGEIEIYERKRPAVPPEWYFPYDNGVEVPPLASFGHGYRFNVTGLYHDKAGFPTLRDDEIEPWFDRVFGKIEHHLDDIIEVQEEMMDDAETVLVSFGASARAAHAAMRLAREKGIPVGMIKLKTIWPFPERAIDHAAVKADKIVVPEMNRGQIRFEVERIAAGRARVVGVNRCGGPMITPEDVLAAIEG